MSFSVIQAQVVTFKLRDPSNARKYTLTVNTSKAKVKLTFSETTAISNEIFYYHLHDNYVMMEYIDNLKNVGYGIMLFEGGNVSLDLPNEKHLSLRAINQSEYEKALKTLRKRLKRSRIKKQSDMEVGAALDSDEDVSSKDELPPIDLLEKKPEFPGGMPALMEYLKANLKYPEKALNNKVQGTVLVRFIVSKTGDIKDVKVMKSVNPDCDNEAIRVVEAMPKWMPGVMDGKPVNCLFNIPISFKLCEPKVE